MKSDATTTMLIAIVVFFLAAVFVTLVRKNTEFRVAPKPLLTANELEFYGRLKEALPEFAIFPQVAMGAIIRPDASGKNYHRIRGTFAQKIVDFTICHPETLKIVTLIELDDRTHSASKDARRDAITGAAGYPTLRWQSKNRPEPHEIRKAVIGLARDRRA